MKCVVCGKREAVIGGLCAECYIDKHGLVKLPRKIVLVVCPVCGRVKAGKWDRRPESYIKSLVKGAEVEGIEIREDKVVLDLRVSVEGRSVIIRREIPVEWKKELCPRCSRMYGGYYEGILQIRGENVKEILRRAEEVLGEDIVREEEVKGGVDLRIFSRKKLRSFGRQMKKEGRDVKESWKLVGEKDGRKVYRLTVRVK